NRIKIRSRPDRQLVSEIRAAAAVQRPDRQKIFSGFFEAETYERVPEEVIFTMLDDVSARVEQRHGQVAPRPVPRGQQVKDQALSGLDSEAVHINVLIHRHPSIDRHRRLDSVGLLESIVWLGLFSFEQIPDSEDQEVRAAARRDQAKIVRADGGVWRNLKLDQDLCVCGLEQAS